MSKTPLENYRELWLPKADTALLLNAFLDAETATVKRHIRSAIGHRRGLPGGEPATKCVGLKFCGTKGAVPTFRHIGACSDGSCV
jgi:hypothetical protein